MIYPFPTSHLNSSWWSYPCILLLIFSIARSSKLFCLTERKSFHLVLPCVLQGRFHETPMIRSATLLKARLWHRCFPVNFVKFPRTPFLTEQFWWLLLDFLKVCDSKKLPFSQAVNTFTKFWLSLKFYEIWRLSRMSLCWSLFSCFRTDYEDLLCKSPYAV